MADKLVGKASPAMVLFGEYFAESGSPIVAFPIDEFVEVKVDRAKQSFAGPAKADPLQGKKKDLDDIEIDNQLSGEKYLKSAGTEKAEAKMFDALFGADLEIQKKGLKISIGGTLTQKTQGYLSALSVALARAINPLGIEEWKEEKLFEKAVLAEKIANDDPLKIHKGCAVHNAFVLVEESAEKVKPRAFHPAKPLFLVIAKLNVKSDAEALKKKISEKKSADPKAFDAAVAEIKKLISKSKKEFSFGGMQELGKMMTQNQAIISRMGFSSPEAEQVIKISTYEGAFGAKISGYEGKVLILCEGEAQQDRMMQTLTLKGFKTQKIKVR